MSDAMQDSERLMREVNNLFKSLKPLTVETPKVVVTQSQKDKIDLLVASYMMFATTKQVDYEGSLKVLDSKWNSMFEVT